MTFRSPSPKDDAAGAKPLVTWHQGGPGGNSFYGLFGEEGYFQVSEEGTRVNNATSWNLVALPRFTRRVERPRGVLNLLDGGHGGDGVQVGR